MPRRIIIRDAKGRFVSYAERYTAKAKSIQVRRRDEYGDTHWTTVAKGGKITPKRLAEVTTRTEFESMPEARQTLGTYKSNKKYKAWNIAEQIDKTKGTRNKLLRITMNLLDGPKRPRKVVFYHIINSNQKRSYHIFRRMNDALGMEGLVLYKRAGARILPDRKGRTVKLVSVQVEKVI